VSDRSRHLWLLLALLGSALWSLGEILHDIHLPRLLQPGVAARVNDHVIDRDSIDRTVAGMDARLRGDEAATRHDVLSRMIDEELLVQHALDTGAARTNPEVRAALVRSAITRLNDETAAAPLTGQELETYFAAHRQAYATATRLTVTALYFASPAFPDLSPARARAAAAVAALRAGTSVEQVAALADALPLAMPADPVSAATLANYLGPDAAAAVSQVPAGTPSEVLPFDRGVVVLYLRARSGGDVPALSEIRELVAADAMRNRQEDALQRLLGSLRRNASIDIATTHPATAAR
jgi:hypothetical protein